jgi:hypothetical protein
VAELVTCSCGAIVPEAELEEHMAGHGVEADSYAGAKVRQFLEEHRNDPPAGDPDADDRDAESPPPGR